MQINTAHFEEVHEEYNLRRSILVQEQCGGQDGFPAIGKVKDHGWLDSSSLTYVLVQEKSVGTLFD